ncbi:MAG: sulfatase [Geminicoccaceae bacterium]
MSRKTFSIAVLLNLCVFLTAVGVLFAPSTAAVAAERPNIVVLLADDMNTDDLAVMPRTIERMAQQGVQFTSYYTNVSLCGPARATFLTGRYTQNTRVNTNSHPQWVAAPNEYRNIAYWLNGAGYRTALIGKYMNAYPRPMPSGYIPPGWNYWFALQNGDIYKQYGYEINDNGETKVFGTAEEDYGVDVMRDRAIEFIRTAAADGVPYFCYLAFNAPHSPSTPPLRYATTFTSTALPTPPSFNEADVSDKPAYIQALPQLTTLKLSSLKTQYRKRLRSLQAVDEAVAAVIDAIGDIGLQNTYVIFASDNGYLLGQHRATGKSGPYEEMVRQTLLIRGPAIGQALSIGALTGNADIVPTILEWTDVRPSIVLDGRSLAGWLGQNPPPEWRIGYPLRQWGTTGLIYPKFMGFRTSHHAYFLYADGQQEFYDMVADPYQLSNLAGELPPETLASYAAVATDLAKCRGDTCRMLDRDPRLPD